MLKESHHTCSEPNIEAVELTDTAQGNSSLSEKRVPEPALGKKMQAHTCAYRRSGLVRVVRPTSGRGIIQNPC